MQYKLVVLDMDGTLLNGENEVSKGNRETIFQLMEQGVQFILASGRPYESLIAYAEDLGMDLPVISANGALVKSAISNDVYFTSNVPSNLVKEILHAVEGTSFAVSLYLEDGILTFDDNMMELHKNLEGIKARKIESFTDDLPVLKILLSDHPDKVTDMFTRFELKYENDLYITSSEPYFLEIMNNDASKGLALSQLMKKMEISAEEVVVLGNNFNDVAMFDVAGFSVAMANSPQDVQGMADFVTKTNAEDGVAYALRKLFKGRF